MIRGIPGAGARKAASGLAVFALLASPFLAHAAAPDGHPSAVAEDPGGSLQAGGGISPAAHRALTRAPDAHLERIAEERQAAASEARVAEEAAALPEIPEPAPPRSAAEGREIVATQAAKVFDYRPGPGINTAEVRALVIKHLPADQVGNAMAVARCESGHSNGIGSVNRNGTRDWGVFQLNDGGTLQGALRRIGVGFSSTGQAQQIALDAETNIRAARAIWDSRGWAPWVCAYKTGVVASLYSNTPGPVYGRFNGDGLPGTPWAPAPAPAPAPTPPPPPPQPPTPPGPTPTDPPTSTGGPGGPSAPAPEEGESPGSPPADPMGPGDNTDPPNPPGTPAQPADSGEARSGPLLED